MSLIFIDRIPASERMAFQNKVIQISQKLGINPNWLMLVMMSESGLNPKAQNPLKPYPVGLIQFVPDTAYGLGTSPQALLSMSAVQQLDYVYKYFSSKAGQFKSVFDLYLYNFYPYAIGKPDSYVIGSERGISYDVADVNKGFDLNQDKKITVGEFKEYIRRKYKNYFPKLQAVQQPKNSLKNLIFIVYLLLELDLI